MGFNGGSDHGIRGVVVCTHRVDRVSVGVCCGLVGYRRCTGSGHRVGCGSCLLVVLSWFDCVYRSCSDRTGCVQSVQVGLGGCGFVFGLWCPLCC